MGLVNGKIYTFLNLLVHFVIHSIQLQDLSNEIGLGSSNTLEATDQESQIYNGIEVEDSKKYPFFAYIQQFITTEDTKRCGGSIVSSLWVLTACHCIDQNVDYSANVTFGTILNPANKHTKNRGVTIPSKQYYLHPDCLSHNVNDIALLRMSKLIKFNDKIQPIVLHASNHAFIPVDGLSAHVIGFGNTGSLGYTKDLQETVMEMYEPSKCKISEINIYKIMCGMGLSDSAICEEDSGGPLFVYRNDIPVQVGIASIGRKKCEERAFNYFTKVAFFSEWIKSIIDM